MTTFIEIVLLVVGVAAFMLLAVPVSIGTRPPREAKHWSGGTVSTPPPIGDMSMEEHAVVVRSWNEWVQEQVRK